MKIIALDCETWPVQPGLAAPRLVCGAFAERKEPGTLVVLLLNADETVARVRTLLADPDVVIVNQAMSYDAAVTAAYASDLLSTWWRAYRDGRVRCVQIRQRLINLALGTFRAWPKYDLAAIVRHHLGFDIGHLKTGPDAWRLRYNELDGTPIRDWPQEAIDYAKGDAEQALLCFEAQQGEARNANIEISKWTVTDEIAKANADWGLRLRSCRGVRTNGGRIEVLADGLAEQIGDINVELQAAGLMTAAGKMSMKMLLPRIEAAYDGTPPRGEPTEKMQAKGITIGNIKRDAITLIGSSDPLLRRYGATIKPAWHLKNTIAMLRRGVSHPINTRYSIPVATGRTSSSSPPMQNWAKAGGYRECLEPRPGNVFAYADYAQLELCTLAQIWTWMFGQSSLTDAIRAGKDLHLMLAAELIGIPYEQLDRENPEHEAARTFAKIGNYGIFGGMGPAALHANILESVANGHLPVEMADKTIEDCAELKQAMLRIWTEARPYFKRVGEIVAMENGRVVQWVSGRVRMGCGYCNAANTQFQGLAADGATLAATQVSWESDMEPESPLYGCWPIGFFHDEDLIEVREDRAAAAAERLSTVMVDCMRIYTPDVPIEAKAIVARVWSKSARAVRGPDGGLIPWEPKEPL